IFGPRMLSQDIRGRRSKNTRSANEPVAMKSPAP
ncbi:hypothetical protein AVEN_61857-1, partial [Araneus ventricosus]